MLALILFIIVLALIFDFLNGFHDAANSIATIVYTRVLTPVQAVAWAAFFNFAAAFIFGTKVAGTIAKGLVVPDSIDVYVVLAGLLGACAWNLITWWRALPTSSSHALVGAIAGAAIAKAGFGCIIASGWVPLLAFIVLSPLIGFVLGGLNMVAFHWLFRRTRVTRVNWIFRKLQLVSAALYSLGHGGNDAQKTMGIIVLLLATANLHGWYAPGDHQPWWLNPFGHDHSVAWWIILSCHAAISLGTMCGGWRIVKTMGGGITKLQPVGGCSAELAAAGTLGFATHMGIPISTTHAITGAILGVGSTRGVRSVRWIWGQKIVTAWVLTIPCAATMAAACYLLVHWTIEPFFR